MYPEDNLYSVYSSGTHAAFEKKMRLPERHILNVLTATLSWSLMSLLFMIFFTACLNPSHQVVIDVNAYGEMIVEIVLFAVIWLLTTAQLVFIWKRLLRPADSNHLSDGKKP